MEPEYIVWLLLQDHSGAFGPKVPLAWVEYVQLFTGGRTMSTDENAG